MKTGRGVRLPTHPCGIKVCDAMIARRHILCSEHYRLVPRWLQVRLGEALNYGIAWKCHPTQDYLDLRAQAIALVLRECERRHAKPAEQLPIFNAS